MKHVVTGLTLALLAATSTVASAADPKPAGAAGSVEKASTFANGNVATIIAIGAGAATGIAVYVLGASDGSNSTSTGTSTSTSTSTSTATATTR